ncbi:MAG: SDR family oxidoreductase, partial [Actinobacteria bacterium]|nr:SDR family oxidoreductase [Actinomycetota bacterium]
MRALVTGGARGLGEAIAERVVRDGADVAIMDVADSVHDTAKRPGSLRPGAVVLGIRGDVSVEEEAERGVAEAAGSLGGLDLLVNNAGIGGPTADLVDAAVADLRRVLDVNLLGAMLVARAAARVMIPRGSGGCIVNIGSFFGQQGVAGAAAYCASKAGVALLTHSLALEVAPHGIRVNTIAPGNMDTEMHRADLRVLAELRGTTMEEELERVRATIPLGRHGTGEDVAGAVAWLASDDA